MKEIKLFEQVRSGEVTAAESGIPFCMFQAYNVALYSDNQLLDFHEVIWNDEITRIDTTLQSLGITEFTISSTFSSLIETLAIFDELGWKMAGIVTVNAPYKTLMSDEWERIPAIKMIRKEA